MINVECVDVRLYGVRRRLTIRPFTDRQRRKRHVSNRVACERLNTVIDAAAKAGRVRVRCGKIEDASNIARISEQAFGLNSQSLQSLQSLGRVGQLIAAAADASDVGNQIIRTLKDKRLVCPPCSCLQVLAIRLLTYLYAENFADLQANEEARTFTLQLQARIMRAEWAAIQQGRQSSSLLQLSPTDRCAPSPSNDNLGEDATSLNALNAVCVLLPCLQKGACRW